ncbi:MAG: LysR substrate-binding domain-containing protein [Paracoccaceae bacterium]
MHHPPRRLLPSISALLAFEAVARRGSATDAAHELSVTQSAISRQLKVLENQIGVALLRREGRRLVLTRTGRDYVEEVRAVLSRLGTATQMAAAPSGGGVLDLAILPAFGTHWLAPRLPDFAERHPGVTVHLTTRLAPFDFRAYSFDAAIHFGRKDWAGVEYLHLMPETVLPVAAPSRLSISEDQIVGQPLLHLETRPRAWARWMAARGLPEPRQQGMLFDQFGAMAQAAIAGLGIALLPDFVAKPHLNNGQLVLASSAIEQSVGAYYLVWPSERADYSPLSAFRSWICKSVDLV